VPEIARAFLVEETAMGRRITPPKAKIKAAKIPYGVPFREDLPARVTGVLAVLYLIFNEGYLTSDPEKEAVRSDLTAGAIRLTRLVRALMPADGEVAGLLTLMLLTEARRAARVSASGELVALDEQDRGAWDGELIAEGHALVRARLASGQAPGRYQILAAINAIHTDARDVRDTDWSQVVAARSGPGCVRECAIASPARRRAEHSGRSRPSRKLPSAGRAMPHSGITSRDGKRQPATSHPTSLRHDQATRPIRSSCPGGPLDFHAPVLPEGCVVLLQGHAFRVRSHRAVKLFAQDVGVAGVPAGLGKDVDQDVEEFHVGAWPPRHVAGGVDGEGIDRRVAVVPHSPVSVDDVGAGLVLGRPHVGKTLGLVVPPGQGLRERTLEDLAEVPGFPGRQMLDQAQEVGPGDGQRAADVVFGEAVDLGEHRLAHLPQVIVQIRLPEVIDHGTGACHRPAVGSTPHGGSHCPELTIYGIQPDRTARPTPTAGDTPIRNIPMITAPE
jgi:hypothetical protein